MYRWIDHTSELELRVEAGTDGEVLEDATSAVVELLRGEGDAADGDPIVREVIVDADDRAQLLAAWLEELVFLAETEAVIPERVELHDIDDRGLRARVAGRGGEPPGLIEAVTYHGLSFDRTDSGWAATVVLRVPEREPGS
jgi:protein archease